MLAEYLYRRFSIRTYCVGDVYTTDANGYELPANVLRKWFVSVDDDSPFSEAVTKLSLSDSREEAEELAILELGLVMAGEKCTQCGQVDQGECLRYGEYCEDCDEMIKAEELDEFYATVRAGWYD